MELWTMVLTGGVGAAAIKLLDHVIQWGLKRWEGRREGVARVETEQERKINGLQAGLRVVLLDRIQYLGQCYLADGEISFDDRRRLHRMYDAYHTGLNGNGDLDVIMAQVDRLPLKH